MLHYTDTVGYNAIRSQPDWVFKAMQPPGEREKGAYFTTLRPDAYRFSARTRIPKVKQAFVFSFSGEDGLAPIEGGRGAYIFISRIDYLVIRPRQQYNGATEKLS